MHRWPYRKFQAVVVCYEYVSRVFKVRARSRSRSIARENNPFVCLFVCLFLNVSFVDSP